MPRIMERQHADTRGVPYRYYWNVPRRRLRVHFEDCPHCNYGRGKHATASTVKDDWEGPFDRIREAWDAAQQEAVSRGLRDVAACRTCLGIWNTESPTVRPGWSGPQRPRV
jgi:hypothetical protein